MNQSLAGKIAIVTGAASGIGRGLAEALSARGATVVLADLDDLGARAAAEGIVNAGGNAEARHLDVADHAAVERLVESTAAAHGRIDFMFNNAGFGIFGETRDMEFAHWRRIVDVNLLGVIAGATAAYRVMVRQGSGHIVNIASVAGLSGFPLFNAYSTTKAGVVMFSSMLRAEGEGLGVRVSAVCPGFIRTGIYDGATYLHADAEEVRRLPFPMMDLAPAIERIMAGVEGNRGMIVFPFYARLGWWLARWLPGASAPLHRRVLERFRRIRKE